MQPIQTLRLAAVTLLLTAGFPLFPTLDFPLPAVAQTVSDRKAEGDRLLQQGIQQFQTREPKAALQSSQQTLQTYRAMKDVTQARELIHQTGAIAKKSKNSKLENSARQILTVAQKSAKAEQEEEAERLDTQALEQLFKGEFEAAYQSSQQALTIYRALKDRRGELGVLFRFATTLAVVSIDNSSARVRQYYEQALVIARELEDRETEKSIVDNLNLTQGNLEDYCRREIENNEQKLATDSKLQDQNSEIWTFGSLGGCYYSLQNYAKASMYYERMITLARKLQNSSDKNDVLIGLSEEGSALDGLGEIYAAQGDYAKAIEYHQKHLEVLNKSSFASSDSIDRVNPFSNIGYALQQQNQPELAIAFYKQAVNILESSRQSSRKYMRQWEQSEFKPSDFDRAFSRWGQQAIASANSSIYRRLADLLLQQNRIIEAMQVLDLLKVEDLQDFLKDVKGNERTAKGLEFLLQEVSILERVNQSSKPSLNDLLKSSAIQSQVQTLQRTATKQNLQLNAYKDLQARIQKLGKNIALFYPLILDDRLELVLFIPDRPPIRKTIAVKRTEFEGEIRAFRQALTDPSALFKVRQSAQKLYTWLVQPLDADLKAAKVQTIVYAPDGQMRYVPLAALHDGEQWLTQRYQINYLTALALTPLEAPPLRSPNVLAGALTQGRTITVAGKGYRFGPLDYTQVEVEQLAKTIPNTKSLIDQPFNRKNLLAQMPQATIVHLATHAKFGGTPEESFIVLGNGDTVTLREIEAWKLPNVSLFVLSACETGLGGKLGNGLEVLGFGYQMQRTGSRAAIASLWAVKDDSTSRLMDEFYHGLQKGLPKTEALRQAQIRLIGQSSYRHPLYWAPFILIGNGL